MLGKLKVFLISTTSIVLCAHIIRIIPNKYPFDNLLLVAQYGFGSSTNRTKTTPS